MSLLKGITRMHLLRTLLFTLYLTAGVIVFHKLHIASTWPALFTVIFFIAYGMQKEKIMMIFAGGIVGLLFGYAIPITLGTLTPIVGAEYALYIYIAAAIFIILGLSAISHTMFNSVSFLYAYTCLMNVKLIAVNHVNWMLILIIGGAALVGGIYGINNFLSKMADSNIERLKSTNQA